MTDPTLVSKKIRCSSKREEIKTKCIDTFVDTPENLQRQRQHLAQIFLEYLKKRQTQGILNKALIKVKSSDDNPHIKSEEKSK